MSDLINYELYFVVGKGWESTNAWFSGCWLCLFCRRVFRVKKLHSPISIVKCPVRCAWNVHRDCKMLGISRIARGGSIMWELLLSLTWKTFSDLLFKIWTSIIIWPGSLRQCFACFKCIPARSEGSWQKHLSRYTSSESHTISLQNL